MNVNQKLSLGLASFALAVATLAAAGQYPNPPQTGPTTPSGQGIRTPPSQTGTEAQTGTHASQTTRLPTAAQPMEGPEFLKQPLKSPSRKLSSDDWHSKKEAARR